MSHHSVIKRIAIDVSPDDHDRELEFWKQAIGQELPEPRSTQNSTEPPR